MIINFRNNKYWESIKETKAIEEKYKVDEEYNKIDKAIFTRVNSCVP
jgi:hypothetical protein